MGTRITIVAVALFMLAFICSGLLRSQQYIEPEAEREFLLGDVDGDGAWCLGDPVMLVYHLFRDGRELPCPASADFDGSNCLDVNDVVYGLRFLFIGDVYVSGVVPESKCWMPPA